MAGLVPAIFFFALALAAVIGLDRDRAQCSAEPTTN
jgi:hypothetical protein